MCISMYVYVYLCVSWLVMAKSVCERVESAGPRLKICSVSDRSLYVCVCMYVYIYVCICVFVCFLACDGEECLWESGVFCMYVCMYEQTHI
jgi:hypothetical protein